MTISVDTGNVSSKGNIPNAISPQSWDHFCGIDVNLLVVCVTIFDVSPTDGVVSGVTYSGTSFTQGTLYYDSTCDGHVSVWFLENPIPTGTYSVEVSFGGTVTDFEASAVGVEGSLGDWQVDSTGTPVASNGSPTITWDTQATNTIVFDAALSDQKDPDLTADGTQVEIHNTDMGADQGLASYNILSSAGSQTMSWTDPANDEDWVSVGIAFAEVAAPQTVTLNSLTLAASAESLTVVAGVATIITDELTLTSSAQAIKLPVIIALDSLYLQSIVATYMDFDGVDSIVNCGSDSSLDDLADEEFTIEVWFKPDGYGQSDLGWIASKGGVDAGNTAGWLLRITNYIGVDNYVATTGTWARDNTGADNPSADGRWHHLAVYFNDVGDRAVHNALDGNWVTGTHLVGEGPIEPDADTDLIFGNRSDNGAYAWDGGIAWLRISDNDRYNHGVDFTPPPLSIPPRVDGNTIEQWNAKDGSGGTLTAEVLSPTNDGALTDVTWVVGTEITVTADAVSITLDTLTLASNAETINVSTIEPASISLNELTLASSAENISLPVIIALNELTLASSLESLTVAAGIASITLNELTLASSLESLIAITPGAVTVTANELTLSGSAEILTVSPGIVSISTNELTLSSSLEALTNVTPGTATITVNELTLSSSAEIINVTGAAVSITTNELTLSSSAEAITIALGAASVVLNELTLSGNAEALTVSPSAVSVTTNELTLISSAEAITIALGAVSVSLNELTLASSAEAINILATIALNELTLSSSAEQINVVATAVSITLNELTLTSSAEQITIVLGAVPQTVSVNELTLSSSAEVITIAGAAISITINTLTLISSPESIAIPVIITVNTITLSSSTETITVVLGAVSVLVNTLTLSGSAETITITASAVTLVVSELTLVSSAEQISINAPSTLIVSTLTITSSAEAITISAIPVSSISLDTLTLASSLLSLSAITPSAVSIAFDTLILVATAVSVQVQAGALDGLHGVTIADLIVHDVVISNDPDN